MSHYSTLKEIFKRVKNLQVTDADLGKRIMTDLKLESIDVAELADEIEKNFNVNLLKSLREKPASDANPLNFSIGELLELIEKK